MKRKVSGIMLTLLLMGLLALAFNMQPVKTEPATIIVPDDYPTIQEAINNADEGDAIFVRSGIYYENLSVNKSVSLVGENKYGTIVDGNFTGTVVRITADNVSVTNFTIRNGKYMGDGVIIGRWNYTTTGCNINNNIMRDNAVGIELREANNNTIADNLVFCPLHKDGTPLCWNGILMYLSNGNIITNNTISSGYVALYLGGSDCNIVNCNRLCSNWYGIRVHGSSNNTIVANEVFNNTRGIHIASYTVLSINNRIYHNDFINNIQQATESNSTNIWDNGYPLGGNFWSDYGGTDFYSGHYQNETGSDGIGDTPHIIPDLYDPWIVEGQDSYPLMKPFFWWNLADVNYDLKVDLYDAVKVLRAYGSEPGDGNWNPQCDIAEPYNKIDIYDATLLLTNYGEKYS